MSAPESPAPALPITTRARQGYCWRLLLVALGMGAAAVWFAFDATVTYPQHNRQHAQVEAFEKEHGTQASALWPAHAQTVGLDPNYNAAKGTSHSKMDILTQWIMCGATACFGLLFTLGFLLARRRFVRWNGTELSNHRGVVLKITEMDQLDMTQWEDKGVATVEGKPGTIKLDDWKMDPILTEAIVAALTAAGVKVLPQTEAAAPMA